MTKERNDYLEGLLEDLQLDANDEAISRAIIGLRVVGRNEEADALEIGDVYWSVDRKVSGWGDHYNDERIIRVWDSITDGVTTRVEEDEWGRKCFCPIFADEYDVIQNILTDNQEEDCPNPDYYEIHYDFSGVFSGSSNNTEWEMVHKETGDVYASGIVGEN